MTIGSQKRKAYNASRPVAFNSFCQVVRDIHDPALLLDFFLASRRYLFEISLNSRCLKIPVYDEHLATPLG